MTTSAADCRSTGLPSVILINEFICCSISKKAVKCGEDRLINKTCRLLGLSLQPCLCAAAAFSFLFILPEGETPKPSPSLPYPGGSIHRR